MFRHTLGRLAGLVLVPVTLTFAGVAPVLADDITADQPNIQITAGDVPDLFDVRVTNLRHDEQMGFVLTGPNYQEFGGRPHTSNFDGVLTFDFKVPRAAAAGAWSIALQGDKGDAVTGAFTATAQAPDIDLMVSTGQDADGRMLSVSTTSVFNDNEPTSYWLINPSGAVVQSGIVDASKKGRLDLDLMLGSDQPQGNWTVTTYSWNSDHYGTETVAIA